MSSDRPWEWARFANLRKFSANSRPNLEGEGVELLFRGISLEESSVFDDLARYLHWSDRIG